eukprot:TRINITY_DN6998_c0_g2_i1.p1 TRINITY_DN6998_c0_g2~~TRINITY_DN6998_c0_g2_i1.p1  ORF type:complete len:806 (+),score=186.18 TRINITY_DN6998_c0_g2_i1:350-2419(+)
MAHEYFKDPENTKKNFDEEGYFNTGDIVSHDPINDRIVVIDRRKHVFKMAQGEFVAPEYLETIYLQSPFVHTIFIHGDTLRDHVLAVVVPNFQVVEEWAKDHGIEEQDKAKLCQHPRVIEAIGEAIKAIGIAKSVQPYEIPRKFLLEPEQFTPENNLLTPSFKLNRIAIEKKYKKQLNELYEEIANEQAKSQPLLNQEVRKKLVELIFQATGIDVDEFNNEKAGEGETEAREGDERMLNEMGVDSLAAIRLQSMLKAEINVEISLDKLLMEEGGFKKLLELVSQPNSKGATTTKAAIDWLQEVQLPTEVLDRIKLLSSKKSYASDPVESNYFLTGATGFLGAFMLFDLLREHPDSKVYCLVRKAKTLEEGKRLITDRLRYSRLKVTEEETERIVPVLGDLSKPLLGLTQQDFEDLASQIQAIYHNGCQVNGLLSYASLRKPNVESTKEIIRLAATGERLKNLYYISSLSAFVGYVGTEDTHFTKPDPVLLNISKGYGATKQVSEILVETAKHAGLRTVIIRPGTIAGDSGEGCVNTTDFLNKFIAGIVQLGYAPLLQTVFDMIPVDFVSKAILCICDDRNSIGKNFHIFDRENTVYRLVDFLTSSVRDRQLQIIKLPYSEWRAKVLEAGEKNVLYPLKSYLSPFGFPSLPDFGNTNTKNALSKKRLVPPVLSGEMVKRWINFMYDNHVI